MTQQASPAAFRSSRPRTGGVKPGNATPQHAIMELKQRILLDLSRLADRDTQQIAVDDLDKIVDTLSPDCVSTCLSCLYDSDMQQKSVVKKECVRLFGSLASTHGDLIVPHLSKIIGSVLRRLRDPDSIVRDACVDAMGMLSSRLISSASSSSLSPMQESAVQTSPSSTSSPALTLATFSKPLMDALSEQNKSVQTGAAMCLGRVIENARDPPVGEMSRLCPRICKVMSNTNFVARPALLSVIGSLSQVGALGQGQLTSVMPCVHEALVNSDWATRKAAAETLGRISIDCGHTLTSFRQLTLRYLESCRFDKVKPVRDSVLDAIQLWKSLPEDEIENSGLASKQVLVTESPESNLLMEKQASQTPSPIASEKIFGPGESPRVGNRRDVTTDVRPSRLQKFSPEKASANVKKKIPSLTDKKVNSEFFQKLSTRRNDDWEIKVAVPRKSPSSSLRTSQVDSKMIDSDKVSPQMLTERSLSGEAQLSSDREMYNNGTDHAFDGEWEGLKDHRDISPMLRDQSRQNLELDQVANSDNLLPEKVAGNQDWETHGQQSRILPTVYGPQRNEGLNETVAFHSLQRQLSQLEQQHSSLLQIVQDFISSSQETIFALQGRVFRLEKVVEDFTCSFEVSRWRSNGSAEGEMSGIMASGGNAMRSEYGNSWYAREPVSEHMNGRSSTVHKCNSIASDEWNGHIFSRHPRDRLCRSGVVNSGSLSGKRSITESCALAGMEDEDPGIQKSVTRRAWDKVAQAGLGRRGEGPSARSVWQASKDEATLAAIRVAGGEKEASDVDVQASGRAGRAIDEQSRGHWNLWGLIMEFVLSGDMESAYTEVLCMGDVMMLIRLMSRTGPVLDQLSDSTANELLHAVAHLLQQRNYLDTCIAWIQQVADMVLNDVAEGMEFSDDAKKELLSSLQEMIAPTMLDGNSDMSLGEQLFQLLVDAWSVNDGEESGT